jgi:hypothetical protein
LVNRKIRWLLLRLKLSGAAQNALYFSSGCRWAFPAELTSMFALPAADLHVRRSHSNPRFNMSILLRCTSRLSQQQNSTPKKRQRTACSGLRRPSRPIRISRGGEGWCSLQGSLEAGFTAQLGLSIGLPGRAHLHVRAAGGRPPCLPGHLEPLLR